MMGRLTMALGKLDSRLRVGLLLVIVSLLIFEGWMLVLRKPYAEYKQIQTTRESLADGLNQYSNQPTDLSKMADELKQLSDRLSGQLNVPASDDKMAASLIEALDKSALLHGITLSSVKPGERKQVSVFEEVAFEVSAKGRYLELCKWMLNFGETLGNSASVTEFDIKSANEGQLVTLSLKIALYRPLKLSEAKNK